MSSRAEHRARRASPRSVAIALLGLIVAPGASAAQALPVEGALAPLLLGVAFGLLIYNLVVACFVRDTVYLW